MLKLTKNKTKKLYRFSMFINYRVNINNLTTCIVRLQDVSLVKIRKYLVCVCVC